jgi:hypothetical protein
MTVIPKVVWLLTFSVALTIGGSAAFAKNGSGPGEAKTSGKSGAVSGNAAGRRIAHPPRDAVIKPLVRAQCPLREPRAATIP